MKMTHFALAMMAILVCITGYLAWEGQQAAKGQREELEYQRKKIEAMEAAYPKKTRASAFEPVATTPVTMPADPIVLPGTPTATDSAPLTSLQKQVLGMPVVARVTSVELTQGFVVINAGKNKKLVQGQAFDVRRSDGVIGRVVISDAIEEAEAVADISVKHSLPGMTIEAGDELILPVTPTN